MTHPVSALLSEAGNSHPGSIGSVGFSAAPRTLPNFIQQAVLECLQVPAGPGRPPPSAIEAPGPLWHALRQAAGLTAGWWTARRVCWL